ncbi:MAG TPA: cytochrome-c peroxidase, partial [Polyangiaceae bacterium]|nr:cytochrome-c peroxidase [Polyangiaceae bacterium]
MPADFPDLPVPEDNVPTPARIALGRTLFYDERVSRNQEVSCASCHKHANGFADPEQFSLGVDGQRGARNASSLV